MHETCPTFWFWCEGRWPGSGGRDDVGEPRVRSNLLPFRQDGPPVTEYERLPTLPHDGGDGPANPVAGGRHVEFLERDPRPNERQHRALPGNRRLRNDAERSLIGLDSRPAR